MIISIIFMNQEYTKYNEKDSHLDASLVAHWGEKKPRWNRTSQMKTLIEKFFAFFSILVPDNAYNITSGSQAFLKVQVGTN